MSPPTLASRMLLRVVDHCAARGIDERTLLQGAGLTRGALEEPEARVPYAVVELIGTRALTLTGDADFGLHLAQDAGQRGHIDAGLLLLMATPTVRSALEQMVRHQRFWGDGDRARLIPLPDGLAIRYLLRGASGAYARHVDECALGELAVGLRALSGHDITPRAVRFRHAPPASLAEHRALFRCPIEFRSAHTELELDGAAGALPMRHANAMFLSIFQKQVERALARLPPTAQASGQVRAVVRAALGSGRCTLAATARALGVSARTMQRQLRDEGTSFAAVVDALRRELACAYLDRGLPVPEVAALLGYTDPTAFHHAFRRWTGSTPLRHARRARAARA